MPDREPMEGDTVSYVIYTATAQNGADLRPVKAPLGFDVLRLARLEGTRTNNQILQNTFKIDQTNTTNSPLPTASDNSLSVSLSEQFKWGAVVCVGVFIIVFACVLTAYWVHKKQQEFMRSRIEDLERRRAGLISPFTISQSDNSSLQGIDNAALQLPPPYLEVISIPIERDPPPSYVEAIKQCASKAIREGEVRDQVSPLSSVIIMPPLPPYCECAAESFRTRAQSPASEINRSVTSLPVSSSQAQPTTSP